MLNYVVIFIQLAMLILLVAFTIGAIKLILAGKEKRSMLFSNIGGLHYYLRGRLSESAENQPYKPYFSQAGSASDQEHGAIKQSRFSKEFIDSF